MAASIRLGSEGLNIRTNYKEDRLAVNAGIARPLEIEIAKVICLGRNRGGGYIRVPGCDSGLQKNNPWQNFSLEKLEIGFACIRPTKTLPIIPKQKSGLRIVCRVMNLSV